MKKWRHKTVKKWVCVNVSLFYITLKKGCYLTVRDTVHSGELFRHHFEKRLLFVAMVPHAAVLFWYAFSELYLCENSTPLSSGYQNSTLRGTFLVPSGALYPECMTLFYYILLYTFMTRSISVPTEQLFAFMSAPHNNPLSSLVVPWKLNPLMK